MPVRRKSGRCAFVKLYGMISAIIASTMVGASLLATIGTGLQVVLSQPPAWGWFKTSLVILLYSFLLLLIALGREFGWWHLHGETLDLLALIWLGGSPFIAGIAYWLVR